MKKLLPDQWIEFQNIVGAMPDSSAPQEILHTILSWLRRYSGIFSEKPFSNYSLAQFLALQEENYPTQISSMHSGEFKHFKTIIKKYKAKDSESIARYLRDALENLVVIEVDRQCPRCKCWGLNAYKNRKDKKIAFECPQCGFARNMEGIAISTNEITFATNDDLRRAGLI